MVDIAVSRNGEESFNKFCDQMWLQIWINSKEEDRTTDITLLL